MSSDVPDESVMENILEFHKSLQGEMGELEDAEVSTEELVANIADEGNVEIEELRELLQEEESEVEEIEKLIQAEEEAEEGEKDVFEDFKGMIDSTINEDERKEEELLNGLENALEDISQKGLTKEGIKAAMTRAGEAVEGIGEISDEELGVAEGLDDMSQLVLQTAQEEEHIVEEVGEIEEIAQEGDQLFQRTGSKKGDKLERKLVKKGKEEEKQAVQELQQAQTLTEMEQEEMTALREEIERSHKEARELYGDLDNLGRDLEESPKKTAKYEAKIQKEQKQVKKAMKKMKKAIQVLKEAEEYESQTESVESEAEQEA